MPMTVATDRRMTLKEYLVYEDGTDIRYELEDGVLVEMGAETPLNPRIAAMLMFMKCPECNRFIMTSLPATATRSNKNA